MLRCDPHGPEMINNEEFAHIIDSYGTPTYVFDENEVRTRTQKIRDILGRVSLCYSVKANPFLIPALIPAVKYFEVCSPGELSICKAFKVPPDMIIYSGVHKEADDIEKAIEYGAAIITAESVRHRELICEASKKYGKPTNVILRLTSKNQFGMSLEDVRSVLSNPCESIKIIGMHYFAGTGRKQNNMREKELDMLAATIRDLREESGLELPMLEYGPGLPFPYFTDEDHSDTLKPLNELVESLDKVSDDIILSVEMGRFIASSCGYYITSVCDIKNNADSDWCIIDGGINHINYLGQMMGMKTPVIRHFRDGEEIGDNMETGEADNKVAGDSDEYTVCGSLCTTNDIVVRKLRLNDLRIGDTLIFTNIGAYSATESMGLFLSRTLPRIVMFGDNGPRLVRDHIETWKINTWDR